jgi:shikimate dehydrogenase
VSPPPESDEATGRRAAVLGSPIAHSLSPALHLAAYAALGLTGWRYDRIECHEAGLPGLVAGLGPEWAGLSLTMPLKRVAMDVADTCADLARDVGAANTLSRGPDGGWQADNTDVAGIVGTLRELDIHRVRRAVIFGAGGTAQAALAALRELGEPEPTVLVRDLGRATELRETAERLGVHPRILPALADPTPRTLPEADLVISTLPGTAGDALVDLAGDWPGRPALLDVLYAPWPTVLAQAALAHGCRVAGGRPFLLYQALAQVRLMTGRPAPLEVMRAAMEEAAH